MFSEGIIIETYLLNEAAQQYSDVKLFLAPDCQLSNEQGGFQILTHNNDQIGSPVFSLKIELRRVWSIRLDHNMQT